MITMHLHTPPFASISNRGKRHFLERDRGACSASIDLNVPLAASCRFSLGLTGGNPPGTYQLLNIVQYVRINTV